MMGGGGAPEGKPGSGGPGGGPQRGILNVALGYRYPQGAVVGADPATPVVPENLDLTGAPGSRAPTSGSTAPTAETPPASPPSTSTRTPSSCSATPPSPPAGTRRRPAWPPTSASP